MKYERQIEESERNHWLKMTNPGRNSCGVCWIWSMFVICYIFICIICFIEPQWIGDYSGSRVNGYFGLYAYCMFHANSISGICSQYYIFNYNDILSAEFKAATILVLVAILLACIVIFFMILLLVAYCCAWNAVAVIGYIISGILIFLSGLLLFIACLVYPAGWGVDKVNMVCSNSGAYTLGKCELRYAYILAIIAIFVALVLSILAFVLAVRVKLNRRREKKAYIPEPRDHLTLDRNYPGYGMDYAETESKPSILIEPNLTAPSDHGDDRFSDYSPPGTANRRSRSDYTSQGSTARRTKHAY